MHGVTINARPSGVAGMIHVNGIGNTRIAKAANSMNKIEIVKLAFQVLMALGLLLSLLYAIYEDK